MPNLRLLRFAGILLAAVFVTTPQTQAQDSQAQQPQTQRPQAQDARPENAAAKPRGAARLPTRFIPDDSLSCAFLFPGPLLGAEELKLMPTEVVRAWGVENIGIDFADVHYVVAVAGVPGPQGVDFGFGVTLTKDFNIQQLNQNLFAGPATPIDGYQAIPLADSPDLYLHQIGPRSAVVATRNYLAPMITANEGQGALPKLVASLPQISPVMAAAVVEPVRGQLNQVADQIANQLPPPLVGATQIPELLDAIVVAAGISSSDKLRIMMLGRDDEATIELEKVVNDALQFARDMATAQSMQQVQGTGPVPEATRAYIQRLAQEIVTMLKPRRDGRRLMIEIENQGGLATTGVLVGLLLPAVQASRAAARRMNSSNNLKQIMLAFHNYHDTYQGFPDPAIRDDEGKPLLSWRVAILPFIEQAELYEEFHLDEPWDSEHNAKLIPRMPAIFKHPGEATPPGETIYQAIVGENLALKPEGKTSLREITDGTSNTIAVVEVDAAHAVPWTKPTDIEIDLENPLAAMGKALPQGFNAAFMDGSVRFIANQIDQTLFAAMLTRAGGEVVRGELLNGLER